MHYLTVSPRQPHDVYKRKDIQRNLAKPIGLVTTPRGTQLRDSQIGFTSNSVILQKVTEDEAANFCMMALALLKPLYSHAVQLYELWTSLVYSLYLTNQNIQKAPEIQILS